MHETDKQVSNYVSVKFEEKRKMEEGDWVLVYDSSLDNQYSTARKFAKRWFGPYMVKKIENPSLCADRETKPPGFWTRRI